MTKNTYQKILFVVLLLVSLFAINHWVKTPPTETTDSKVTSLMSTEPTTADTPAIKKPSTKSKQLAKDISLNSLDELIELFDSLNYNTESWQAGVREVPRLTFESVSEKWQQTSNEIPVQLKKMVFFRLMAPLILISNENINAEREKVKQSQLNDDELIAIARKYRIITEDLEGITEEQRQQLLKRVDIMPPSLVLAQAAEESGWATSRFTVEGNAFFGQWDFSGNGMIPKQQRKELGNYGLARFDTPQASVEGYMLNINTNAAYIKLRELRRDLRADSQAITGLELANTLDKYSERGQAYIDGIQQMIRYNKLDQVDAAYLSDNAPLHLITSNQ